MVGQIVTSEKLSRRSALKSAAGIVGVVGLHLAGVPEAAAAILPRRLYVRIQIDGKDDENWPDSDERASTSEYALGWLRDYQKHHWIYRELRFGGELRIETTTRAQVQTNGTILVEVKADLYEGTKESTKDHDGSANFSMLVSPNSSRDTFGWFEVKNTDEGGDEALIMVWARNFED